MVRKQLLLISHIFLIDIVIRYKCDINIVLLYYGANIRCAKLLHEINI